MLHGITGRPASPGNSVMWYYVSFTWATFAVHVTDGKIAETAPILRKRLQGRSWARMRPWLENRGARVEEF